MTGDLWLSVMRLLTDMPRYTSSSNTVFVGNNVKELKCCSFSYSRGKAESQVFALMNFVTRYKNHSQARVRLLVSVPEELVLFGDLFWPSFYLAPLRQSDP